MCFGAPKRNSKRTNQPTTYFRCLLTVSISPLIRYLRVRERFEHNYRLRVKRERGKCVNILRGSIFCWWNRWIKPTRSQPSVRITAIALRSLFTCSQFPHTHTQIFLHAHAFPQILEQHTNSVQSVLRARKVFFRRRRRFLFGRLSVCGELYLLIEIYCKNANCGALGIVTNLSYRLLHDNFVCNQRYLFLSAVGKMYPIAQRLFDVHSHNTDIYGTRSSGVEFDRVHLFCSLLCSVPFVVRQQHKMKFKN